MQFLSMFEKMIELLAVITMGYIATKCGLLDRHGRKIVSDLVINIGVPTMCIGSIMLNKDAPTGGILIKFLALSCITYFIMLVTAIATPAILKIPEEHRGQSQFAMFMKNCAFIGFPVAQAIYGSIGVFYTMIANLPFGVFCYSVGIIMVRGRDRSQKITLQGLLKSAKEILFTPAMIASAFSLVLAYFGVRRPVVIADAFSICGQITTPLALIIVGSSLAELPLLKMLKGYKIYIISIVSMLVTPAICYFAIRPFIDNEIMFNIMVIMSGMPAAATGTMFCVKYNKDETYMAQCIFITTLCSMITIPIVATVLQMLQ